MLARLRPLAPWHTAPARRGSVRSYASPGSPPPPPPGPPPPPPPGPPPGGDGGSGGGGGGTGWLRLGASVLTGAVVVAGATVAALPAMLSTQWGLQNVLQLVNTRLPGRLEIASASLSWSEGNEISCLKVYDSPQGGQILMHLNKVSTSASLWRLLTGSDGFNVIISKPWINAVYDKRIADWKLINWMERAGVLNAPPPPPHKQQQRQQQQGGQAPPPPPQSVQQQQQQQPGRLVEVLCRINDKMYISADVRMGRMHVVMADGMLLVPQEVREMLGRNIHISGAVGQAQLREWAEEVQEDVSWAAAAAASPRSSSRSGSGGGSAPTATAAAEAAGTSTSAAAAAAAAAATPPPAEVLRRPGVYEPGVMQVNSEHMACELRLWKADDHTLLHTPAVAKLDLTPELSRFGLAVANPLLRDVVQVQGGGRLEMSFMPENGRLPYEAATATMAPVGLGLGPGSLTGRLLAELGFRDYASDGGGALRASLSRATVHFKREGTLRSERMDMVLGVGRGRGGGGGDAGGVRLAAWGTADQQADTVDFTLGVAPGPLLAALGLPQEGLPEGLLLLAPMHGPSSAPRYELAGAALRLGQLTARQKAVQWRQRREQEAREGKPARGRLAAGLAGAVLSAVSSSPDDIMATIDGLLREDLARTPPPPPAQ